MKNEKKPKYITIIVPAYNEEKNIARCLQSISECNYSKENKEVIVVDNGSNDNTIKIAKLYGAIVLVDGTRTVAGLRNLGAQYAKGEILAFLDADCTVSKNWLNAAIKVLNNGVAIAGSRLKAPLNGNWIEKVWARHLQYTSGKDGCIKYINSGNLFIKQEIFKKIGGFTENLMSNEDVDICEKATQMGYTIFHSSDIEATHWGYPKSLRSFYKREIWHGSGDADRNFPKIWKSKPLLLSTYNCLCVIAALTYCMKFSIIFGLMWLTAILFPPFLLSFITAGKAKGFESIGGLICIFVIYSIARTIAFMQFGMNKMNCLFKNKIKLFSKMNHIPIIVYHKLCYQSQNSYSIKTYDFEQHLEYLKKEKYLTLRLEEYVDKKCNKNIGIIDKCVLITFDDGHESDIRWAMPLLLRYGFKATFFITTDWIDKPGYMNAEQIKQLVQKGMSVQSHAKSHKYLNEKDVNLDLDWELRESKRRLEQITGRTIQFLSFPGGRYNSKVVKAAKNAGYRAVCSSMPFYFKSSGRLTLIGRSMIKYHGRKTNFFKIMNTGYASIIIMQVSYALRLALKRVIGNKFYSTLWRYYNMR